MWSKVGWVMSGGYIYKCEANGIHGLIKKKKMTDKNYLVSSFWRWSELGGLLELWLDGLPSGRFYSY